MLGTLHSVIASHRGQGERSAQLQLDSADALEALGDVRNALLERMIGLRMIPVVPGPDIAARRSIVRVIVDRAQVIGSVRAEIEGQYLLARLDRGNPDAWRIELARIFDLLEEAYPPEQQARDLYILLNEMQIQHRYSAVLDGVARIERSGATQPKAQLWSLTLRAESYFAMDELDKAVSAVNAMQRENFELHDSNSCLFAWLFAEAQRQQRARESLAVCRSREYDRTTQAARADSAPIAQARFYQLNDEQDRAWPVPRVCIDTLLNTPDLALREAESLALLARHTIGTPGADPVRLQRALLIVELIAKRDGVGLELRPGAAAVGAGRPSGTTTGSTGRRPITLNPVAISAAVRPGRRDHCLQID